MNPRHQLADAKAALRDAEQYETTARAIAEQAAIDAAQGKYGSNDTDRKRFLTIALAQNADYGGAALALAQARALVDQIGADIAVMEDERAAQRLVVQERQAAALERFADALGRVPPAVAAAACGVEEWYQR